MSLNLEDTVNQKAKKSSSNLGAKKTLKSWLNWPFQAIQHYTNIDKQVRNGAYEISQKKDRWQQSSEVVQLSCGAKDKEKIIVALSIAYMSRILPSLCKMFEKNKKKRKEIQSLKVQ